MEGLTLKIIFILLLVMYMIQIFLIYMILIVDKNNRKEYERGDTIIKPMYVYKSLNDILLTLIPFYWSYFIFKIILIELYEKNILSVINHIKLLKNESETK